MFGRKKLKAEIKRLRELLQLSEKARAENYELLISYYNQLQEEKSFSAYYRLTDSDFNKKGKVMKNDVFLRMAHYLGRKICNEVGIEEVVEDGVVVAYKIELKARKA